MHLRLNGKTVLVTGVSQDIGEVLAKSFAEIGVNLHLTARNRGNLRRIKGEITTDLLFATYLPGPRAARMRIPGCFDTAESRPASPFRRANVAFDSSHGLGTPDKPVLDAQYPRLHTPCQRLAPILANDGP